MTKYNYINLLFLFFLGVITSFSLPPYNYFFLNFFTFTLFFIFLLELKKNKGSKLNFFLYGWIFGFGYFLSSLYWISISLTFDDNFKIFIPFSLILIPGFLALFYGLSSFFMNFLLNKNNLISSILIFSAILGIFEYSRSFIFSGFPWNLIAYSFSNYLEIIQINSFIGIYSFNLICMTIFLTPTLFLLKKSKKKIIVLLFFIFLFIGNFIYGYFSLNKSNNYKKEEKDYNIVLLSTKISLDRFYSSDNEDLNIIKELIELSKPDEYLNQKTIFIWPEGILPKTSLDNLSYYKNIFQKKFDKKHYIVLGLNREDTFENKKQFYNSLAVIDNYTNVISSYDKVKLVPFGEFLPLENFLSKLGLTNITNDYQSYSSGVSKDNIIYIENKKLSFLPLICYEIIYSGRLTKNLNFDFIINISEDGWFGKSVGPHQHFAHSIFRSIEMGKYVFRAANNGISAIIDPKGNVISYIAHKDKGSIKINNFIKTENTIYSKYKNKIFIILIFIYIFFIFSFNRMKYE